MKSAEIVVITGASAGVGRATAIEFARHGAHIALLARSPSGLEGAHADVEAAGAKALIIPVDVAEPEQVYAAAARVEEELGPIDVWINNAMTTVFGLVASIAASEYRRVTDVTYHGAVWGTMAALERMMPRNRGTIVQVGSALAYRSIPLQSAYCGAKHALRGFTDSLRSELIHTGKQIYLTMVHLPGLNTPQFEWCKSYMPKRAQPVPPIYQPEVAARAIYYAAHHRRREVYVTRSTMKAIIGNKVIPGFLDKYLARVAVDGQQTDEPETIDRPSNLFEPVAGAHATHGRFDERAEGGGAAVQLGVRMGAGGVGLAIATAGITLVVLTTVLAFLLVT